MRAIAAALAAILALALVAAAAPPPDDAVAILWADFCERKPEHPKCQTTTPPPSPTPSPPASATPSPTSPPTATASPSPSASATPAPTPTPTATASPAPTTTPPPTPTTSVTLESQAWWRLAGLDIPSETGQHVHLRATVPADGPVIDGKVVVPVTVTLHNQTGKATSFRVSDGSTVKQSWTIDLGPCADCSWSGFVTVDFSTWGTGRREMRWTANIPTNDEGNRQYQSTGWQVCHITCSPSYRSGPWIEARGWYEGHGYAIARLTSGIESVRSGGTVSVSLKPGSGGDATVFSAAYIDPALHSGDDGIVLGTWNGQYVGSVTLPVLPSGPHRLVLLSSDGQNAGVLVVPFVVP